MLSWIREKFGTVVIGVIISLIAFVFIFYGVYSPKSTRGLHEGAVAGTVNGDAISLAEFNRELNRRMEFFKNLGGGQITEEQLKSFRLRELVFQELVSRKVMLQEAKRQGLLASDELVKDRVQEIPAFKKDGKFDFLTYKQVLEANNYTPGSFEKVVREEIMTQQWEVFFRTQVKVAEEEVKREFQVTKERRNLRYVVLTPEAVKKSVVIPADEVAKFLADPARLNVAKGKFEEGKETLYKGMTFELVKEKITQGILAENKTEEIQTKLQKATDEVMALVNQNLKAPEAKLNAALKKLEVESKSTGWITQKAPYIPGFGESKELQSDAFSAAGRIDPARGGHPQKYQSANRFLVAWVSASESPDAAQFEKERGNLIRQISDRKFKDWFGNWRKKALEHASVDPNPAVVKGDSEG